MHQAIGSVASCVTLGRQRWACVVSDIAAPLATESHATTVFCFFDIRVVWGPRTVDQTNTHGCATISAAGSPLERGQSHPVELTSCESAHLEQEATLVCPLSNNGVGVPQ